MQNFEQKYYESDQFWKAGMVTDEANLNRLNTSIALIPAGTKTLADIGCGNGIFAAMLQQQKPEISSISVDRSETALQHVKTKSQVGDLISLPFADQSFDCVTCLQVLEHIPYPVYDTVLQELSRIAAKNIIISVPFEENTADDITRCPACHATFNIELHLRNYFNADIRQLFSRFGFTCISQQLIQKQNQVYLGIDTYIRFRKRHLVNKGKFQSPLCPVCGYENPEFLLNSSSNTGQNSVAGQPGSGFKALIQKYWPKTTQIASWVIAVYEKA